MSRYRKYENTSVKMGTFYIPSIIKDNNVLSSFKKKVLSNFKAKQEIFTNRTNSKTKIINGDASKLDKIKTNSIDLIYTDPPYGGLINYSELNIVFESWLDIHEKYNNEMIIDKIGGKEGDYYFDLFSKFLSEASRVLKLNRFLILVFHHPEIDIWKKLQETIIESNFEIIPYQEPIRIISSNKTASQRSTNKKTQSFLVFKMQNKKKNLKIPYKTLTETNLKKILDNSIKKKFTSSADRYDFMVNSLMCSYKIKNIEKIKSFLL